MTFADGLRKPYVQDNSEEEIDGATNFYWGIRLGQSHKDPVTAEEMALRGLEE